MLKGGTNNPLQPLLQHSLSALLNPQKPKKKKENKKKKKKKKGSSSDDSSDDSDSNNEDVNETDAHSAQVLGLPEPQREGSGPSRTQEPQALGFV